MITALFAGPSPQSAGCRVGINFLKCKCTAISLRGGFPAFIRLVAGDVSVPPKSSPKCLDFQWATHLTGSTELLGELLGLLHNQIEIKYIYISNKAQLLKIKVGSWHSWSCSKNPQSWWGVIAFTSGVWLCEYSCPFVLTGWFLQPVLSALPYKARWIFPFFLMSRACSFSQVTPCAPPFPSVIYHLALPVSGEAGAKISSRPLGSILVFICSYGHLIPPAAAAGQLHPSQRGAQSDAKSEIINLQRNYLSRLSQHLF